MTEADPFLNAIFDNPDDLVPRLVFANWLDERGYPVYAEFLRVSAELARHGPLTRDQRRVLRERRFHLYLMLADEWPEAASYFTRENYRCATPDGFRCIVGLDGRTFLERWPRWWPLRSATRFGLTATRGLEREIAVSPLLDRVTHLYFNLDSAIGERALSDDMLRQLTIRSRLPRIERLDFELIRARRSTLQLLAEAPFLSRLNDSGLQICVLLSDERNEYDYISGYTLPAADVIRRFLDRYGSRLPE